MENTIQDGSTAFKVVGANNATSTIRYLLKVIEEDRERIQKLEEFTEAAFPYIEKDFGGARWVQIFYHNIRQGAKVWSSMEQLLYKTDDPDMYSLLKFIPLFRKDSTFEFLMEWPEKPGYYNRWKQSSNPTETGSVTGYTAIHIDGDRSWSGLGLTDATTDTFIDGNGSTGNWWFSIGSKAPYSTNKGIPCCDSTNTALKQFTGQQIRLWIRKY